MEGNSNESQLAIVPAKMPRADLEYKTLAESAWDILIRKIFLFCYQIFESDILLSLTCTILLSDCYFTAL